MLPVYVHLPTLNWPRIRNRCRVTELSRYYCRLEKFS
jgi:hypothetical protein